MTYNDFRKQLCNIDASKSCFSFLADRIGSVNYRGVQFSQHNRYDLNIIYIMLKELYDLVGTEKMIIRTTDLKNRPYNIPEETMYARYVDVLCRKLGRCTQDSVRKNLFVDLHRMNLIERYDANENALDPYARGTKKYVKISDLGLDLINSNHTLFERKLRYTRAIDTLTKGLADQLLDIATIDGFITETEFQFFFSFIGKELNGHIYSKTELLDFIKEFRMTSKYQQKFAINTVKEYCDPATFVGDKTKKRDYHNWLNETQQIFMLMGQTAYYEESNGALNIRVGEDSLYENKEKLVRSKNEKEAYFSHHSVNKQPGFELHHIVPLCWAKNALEFSMLDVWKNLIYIDGYKHSIITQKNNEHVRLAFVDGDISLKNFNDDEIYCKKGENVLYKESNQIIMSRYNDDLLNSCGKTT